MNWSIVGALRALNIENSHFSIAQQPKITPLSQSLPNTVEMKSEEEKRERRGCENCLTSPLVPLKTCSESRVHRVLSACSLLHQLEKTHLLSDPKASVPVFFPGSCVLGLCHAKGAVSGSDGPNLSHQVDYREEYANAFRTESYIEFWARVLTLSHGDAATSVPLESTTAARLPSYRLFAEYLLDPDQPSVAQLLASAQTRPKSRSILAEYFSETANAPFLCGLLLKDINRTRAWYRSFKSSLESQGAAELLPVNRFPAILARVRIIQTGCSDLLKRLELGRDKARARLQVVNRIKCGSAVLLIALTASVAVIATTHALALLMAAPGVIVASLELASTRKLARLPAQLDAAAKGTYILNRDMDTVSRLVTRLNNELEHTGAMVRFWLEPREDNMQASGEVARQLKKNDSKFSQQLDELEEHLYLCLMTINRGRKLVVKEVMDHGLPNAQSN